MRVEVWSETCLQSQVRSVHYDDCVMLSKFAELFSALFCFDRSGRYQSATHRLGCADSALSDAVSASDVLPCHQVATQILRSTPRCSCAKRSGSLMSWRQKDFRVGVGGNLKDSWKIIKDPFILSLWQTFWHILSQMSEILWKWERAENVRCVSGSNNEPDGFILLAARGDPEACFVSSFMTLDVRKLFTMWLFPTPPLSMVRWHGSAARDTWPCTWKRNWSTP